MLRRADSAWLSAAAFMNHRTHAVGTATPTKRNSSTSHVPRSWPALPIVAPIRTVVCLREGGHEIGPDENHAAFGGNGVGQRGLRTIFGKKPGHVNLHSQRQRSPSHSGF